MMMMTTSEQLYTDVIRAVAAERIFRTLEELSYRKPGPKISKNVNYTQRGTMEGPKAPSEARRREAPECRGGWGLGRGAVAPPHGPPENFKI